jgi:hypothetical protein
LPLDLLTDITELEFDATLSGHYSLMLSIGANEFSYFVTDSRRHVLRLKRYRFGNKDIQAPEMRRSINQILRDDHLLRLDYKKVYIVFNHTYHIVIPSVLFDADRQGVYLHSVLEVPTYLRGIAYEAVPSLGLNNVYAYDLELATALDLYFPNARMGHSTSNVLKNWLRHAELFADKQVFVQVGTQVVTIGVFEQRQLLLFNHYPVFAPSDCLYYLLLVYEQLHLSHETCPCTWSGEVLEGSEYITLASKYLHTIRYLSRPNYLLWGENITHAVPAQAFTHLFSTLLCEL